MTDRKLAPPTEFPAEYVTRDDMPKPDTPIPGGLIFARGFAAGALVMTVIILALVLTS